MKIAIIILIIAGIASLIYYAKYDNSGRTEVDKNSLPKPPLPVDSPHNLKKELKITKTIPRCGKCIEMEKNISKAGMDIRNKMIYDTNNNVKYTIPNLYNQYKPYMNCEMCFIIVRAWMTHLQILGAAIRLCQNRITARKNRTK